jgi:hypothetical protein
MNGPSPARRPGEPVAADTGRHAPSSCVKGAPSPCFTLARASPIWGNGLAVPASYLYIVNCSLSSFNEFYLNVLVPYLHVVRQFGWQTRPALLSGLSRERPEGQKAP